MATTTLDLDPQVLHELERLQAEENKPLGALVSELVTEALKQRGAGHPTPSGFHWNAKPLGVRVDLTDKDVVYRLLDETARP